MSVVESEVVVALANGMLSVAACTIAVNRHITQYHQRLAMFTCLAHGMRMVCILLAVPVCYSDLMPATPSVTNHCPHPKQNCWRTLTQEMLLLPIGLLSGCVVLLRMICDALGQTIKTQVEVSDNRRLDMQSSASDMPC